MATLFLGEKLTIVTKGKKRRNK